MTKEQEAYIVLQASYIKLHDLQAGDTVRVFRHFGENELGFYGYGSMNDDMTRKRDIIDDKIAAKVSWIDKDRIVINGLSFPFFALEITDQPRETIIEVHEIQKVEVEFFRDGKNVTHEKTSEEKVALIQAALEVAL